MAAGLLAPAIAGLVLSAGTTGLGLAQRKAASRRAAEKQAQQLQLEQQRQAAIAQQSKEKAAGSLAQFTPEAFKESEDEIVGRDLQTIGNLIADQAPAASFTESSAPEVIKAQFAKKGKEASGDVSKFAEALSRFGAQGQALNLANIRGSSNAQRIRGLTTDALVSAGLLGSELQTAGRGAASPIGAALTGVGQAGLSAALGGQFGSFRGGSAPGVTPHTASLAGQSPLLPGNQVLPNDFLKASLSRPVQGQNFFNTFRG